MRCFALLLLLISTTVSAQTLTVGVRGGPESMDPHFSALGVHAEAMKHIFDTLVWADENVQLQPGLAESWQPIDDTTWEFKLRQGVKFHDGSDFTAEDVKFSIERMPVVTGPTTTAIVARWMVRDSTSAIRRSSGVGLARVANWVSMDSCRRAGS